ncbi:MAG: hypothetical protein ACTHY6_12970 [Corynebacterium variabile]|uniref:hypothetical protein n=1 Tax=Corynebacterium variabile TaxID=1727 RepID=UPI003F93B74A
MTPPEAHWSNQTGAPDHTMHGEQPTPWQASAATTKPVSVPGALPWGLVIWVIGAAIYFIGTIIIFSMNNSPENGMEQQLMETVRISDQLMWTAIAGTLTFLAWSIHRIVRIVRHK